MRKNAFLVALFIIGTAAVSCGGGSATKGGIFGKVPGLYADFEKVEAKLKADIEGKDLAAITKLYAEAQAKEKEMEAKVTAELEKMHGKEIPVTYSEALVASGGQYYNARAAITADKDVARLSVTFVAREAFTAGDREKTSVYWCWADKAGMPIAGTRYWMGSVVRNLPSAAKVAANDELFKDETLMVIDIEKNPAGFASAASLKFITKEEYDAVPTKL